MSFFQTAWLQSYYQLHHKHPKILNPPRNLASEDFFTLYPVMGRALDMLALPLKHWGSCEFIRRE